MSSEFDIDDAGVPMAGEYYFLDVGPERYGECTLVRLGKLTVLIDGSHVGDFEGQEGYDSIPTQLSSIFQHEPPYDIDMVVVTHGHADHIGCLPDLVANDIIRPKWALVTHPRLGFGRDADDDDSSDLQDTRTAVLAAALREEDASDLDDNQLEVFLDAVARAEGRYTQMLMALKENGTTVVEYVGGALPGKLARLLRPMGVKLFGPSKKQLLLCAQQISLTNRAAVDAVQSELALDANLDDLELYRRIVSREAGLDSGYSRGSAMNCQSITLAFGPKGQRVLLAGDMQFADPGVRGIGEDVVSLRRAISKHGPYRAFKTTHHTSYNGFDETPFEELGRPDILIHSGGRRDPSHPYPSTLETLKGLRREISFVRTDRNGLIRIRPHLRAADALEVSRGRVNDFTENARDDVPEPPARAAAAVAPAAAATPPLVAGASIAEPKGIQIIIVNLQREDVDLRVAGIDVSVRYPKPGHERLEFIGVDPRGGASHLC